MKTIKLRNNNYKNSIITILSIIFIFFYDGFYIYLYNLYGTNNSFQVSLYIFTGIIIIGSLFVLIFLGINYLWPESNYLRELQRINIALVVLLFFLSITTFLYFFNIFNDNFFFFSILGALIHLIYLLGFIFVCYSLLSVNIEYRGRIVGIGAILGMVLSNSLNMLITDLFINYLIVITILSSILIIITYSLFILPRKQPIDLINYDIFSSNLKNKDNYHIYSFFLILALYLLALGILYGLINEVSTIESIKFFSFELTSDYAKPLGIILGGLILSITAYMSDFKIGRNIVLYSCLLLLYIALLCISIYDNNFLSLFFETASFYVLYGYILIMLPEISPIKYRKEFIALSWVFFFNIDAIFVLLSNPISSFLGKELAYMSLILLCTSVIILSNKLPNFLIEKREAEILKLKNSELSDFVHFIAHDLYNSLHVLEGYTHMLKVDYLGQEESQKKIEILLKHTNSMKILLKRSLELADAGLVIKKIPNVDLNPIIEEVAKVIIPENIIWKHNKFPTISCDPQRIKQVFTNLFENAIIHGKPSKISSTFIDDQDKGIIIITNNGKAIPNELLEKIFARMFSTRKSGTGLGLAIVKKIIEAHGWKIVVESTSEKTSFKIFLN